VVRDGFLLPPQFINCRTNGVMEVKKRIFSALKPTGKMTLGNYIGAVKNMVALQEEFDCFYAVADLHSITVDILPAELRKNSLDMFALLLAFGIDPQKSTLFVQSHVSAHSQLAWVLNCYTQYGEAKRMTQFKDKSAKDPSNINLGLFGYPVLMAADILLYGADLVPIGKDQTQHLELARNIAERFNNKYSPTFTVPDGYYSKEGFKVASLLDPTAKMGKTDDNQNGTIFILDSDDDIRRKFRRAVTDSGNEIVFSEDKPGISNLLTIFSAVNGFTVKEAEERFLGRDYAYLKDCVADAVIEFLRPIKEKYSKLIADKKYLIQIMDEGAKRAERVSNKVISKVYRKVGFLGKEV